jgi:hypothetical protein
MATLCSTHGHLAPLPGLRQVDRCFPQRYNPQLPSRAYTETVESRTCLEREIWALLFSRSWGAQQICTRNSKCLSSSHTSEEGWPLETYTSASKHAALGRKASFVFVRLGPWETEPYQNRRFWPGRGGSWARSLALSPYAKCWLNAKSWGCKACCMWWSGHAPGRNRYLLNSLESWGLRPLGPSREIWSWMSKDLRQEWGPKA